MRKSFKISLLAAVLPLALLAGTSPANATVAAAGLIQGGGIITPPLTPTPVPGGSDYNFAGSITVDTSGLGIAAYGHDSIASLALGEGDVNLTAPTAATGVFIRVGAVVLAVVANQNTVPPGVAAGVFVFTPNPLTGDPTSVGAYNLLGVGGGAGA